MEVNLHIYSGIGNLIAIVDGIRNDLHISSKEVDHVYNFHDVNFDQLIILLPPSDPQNDLDVKIFNNDGYSCYLFWVPFSSIMILISI